MCDIEVNANDSWKGSWATVFLYDEPQSRRLGAASAEYMFLVQLAAGSKIK
jgi:hypothetical protein